MPLPAVCCPTRNRLFTFAWRGSPLATRSRLQHAQWVAQLVEPREHARERGHRPLGQKSSQLPLLQLS